MNHVASKQVQSACAFWLKDLIFKSCSSEFETICLHLGITTVQVIVIGRPRTLATTKQSWDMEHLSLT